MRNRRPQHRRRGAIVILVAVMLFVFIVMAALTVDVAYMQLIRTDLRIATDAAAKAGAEALSRTEDEAAAMAKKVGLKVDQFYRRFARRVGKRWSLNERQTEHGFDCVFLDRDSVPGRAVCRLYDARPMQCRTWPFWPDVIESPESWEATRASTPCPGMGRGQVIPIEAIRIQRDA